MQLKEGINIYPYQAYTGFGITFPAKSILINDPKLLIIISPANFDKATLEEIAKIKKEVYFISPNNYHNINLKKMHDTFPKAQFYGPKRSAKQSGVKLQNPKNLKLDGLLPIPIKGNNGLSETSYYHAPTKTLITTDIVFNMHHKMNFATRVMLTLSGTYHKLSTSRLVKSSIKNKEEFKNSLSQLCELDFENVIIGHGDDIERQEFINHIKTL